MDTVGRARLRRRWFTPLWMACSVGVQGIHVDSVVSVESDWARSSPQQQGMATAPLDELRQRVERGCFQDVSGIVMVKNGTLARRWGVSAEGRYSGFTFGLGDFSWGSLIATTANVWVRF
jgi:hypothetical protein